jgi:A/G-specific adenine glycosylase
MTGRWSGFAGQVVEWQQRAGRSGLPWQNTRDPYRVWLSEIMLQQTQVSTVLDYFPRFLDRFPDVKQLASAPIDDVFALWSGLGYYSRARNLHRCAVEVVQNHGGNFPKTAEALQLLPGIGRSTAAAIAAFCFGERVAILDGNVKRVLSRVLGFDADLAIAANERDLWRQAEDLLPKGVLDVAMPRYTQGLMDIGATLCKRRDPLCGQCPVVGLCVASREGRANSLPVKTRTLKRRTESLWLLVAFGPGRTVWLERRKPKGIWAGLFCVPVFPDRSGLDMTLAAMSSVAPVEREPVGHALTHKQLLLHPVEITLPVLSSLGDGEWFDGARWPALGLPAPVRKMLNEALSNRSPGDA